MKDYDKKLKQLYEELLEELRLFRSQSQLPSNAELWDQLMDLIIKLQKFLEVL